MAVIDGLNRSTHKKEKSIHKPTFLNDFNLNTQAQKDAIKKHNYLAYTLLFTIVAIFSVLGISTTLEYKNRLELSSNQINKEIVTGLEALNSNNFEVAIQNFNQANNDLNKLKINLQSSGQYINYLFYLPKSESKLVEASRILSALSAVTDSVVTLSQGYQQLSKPTKDNPNSDQINLISQSTETFSQLASSDLPKLNQSINKLSQAEDILKNSDSSNYKSLRELLLNKIPEIRTTIENTANLYQIIPLTFAKEGQKKYLILFQNNSELRPSGGFLGSFAVANFQNSKLKSLDFQTNIYKIDKPYMTKNPVLEPEELLYVTSAVAMRDSNWHYDFKESMKKTLWFYHQETGDEANGVIALDTTLVTDLLKIIGPIEMPDYGLSVSADNFLSEIEYQVEIGYFKNQANWPENAPKKILAEMMPKLISRTFAGLSNDQKRNQILNLFNKSLLGKHLLFYDDSTEVQSYLERKNYAGRVQPTNGDYFFLSSSNIGGKKSSLNVKENIDQKIEISSNKIIKTVTVTRQHLGNGEWPDGENKTFNKMVVPEGSKVLEYSVLSGNDLPYSDEANSAKKGMKSYDENGKTIFAFWQNTKPKETSKIIIKYQLPNLMIAENSYQLLIQKQPGTVGSTQKVEVIAPSKQVYLADQLISEPIDFELISDTQLRLSLK